MLTHPSPNHNSRGEQEVKGIVLHADASPSEKGTLSWIQSSQSKVSYHALVGRDGTVYTCVPYDRRAWHSGKADWLGSRDVNGITVGKMARLNGDGTTDDSFINNLGTGFTVDQVFVVTLQANGDILAGGNFQLLDNGPPPVLARVFGDPVQSSGSANSAPLWLQSIGRESASTACPEGYSGSWALWPNGGTGGYVCNKSIPAYGN